jgi:hypothetical protein
VRYVRPCPLMPSVTMGIDAAVTANTNSSNTATREINAPPNFFQGPSFWSPQNPHPATTRTIFQRPRVDAVLPPASFSRAIASKYSLRDRVCSAAPARGLPLDRPAMTQGRPLMRSAIAGPVGARARSRRVSTVSAGRRNGIREAFSLIWLPMRFPKARSYVDIDGKMNDIIASTASNARTHDLRVCAIRRHRRAQSPSPASPDRWSRFEW